MKTLIKLLTIISVVFSSAVFAHVHLEKSVPADNAMLMNTPEKLTLGFSKEVRVVKVTLKDKKGEEFKFGFEPSKVATSKFTWKLPKLAPANYTVDVTFLGNDGHKMKHSFGFMVH